MDHVLGKQLPYLILSGVPFAFLTLLMTVFVLHESPK
jgi:hypothetical protein